MYAGNAERVHIDSEEDGFHFLVKTEDGDWFDFNIHSCADALHEQVNLIIGEWLEEGRAAARMPASAVFRCNPDESGGYQPRPGTLTDLERSVPDPNGGYDQSDPKHPEWHSTHADLYDNREKV